MDVREVGGEYVALDGSTAYRLAGPAADDYRAGGISRRRMLAAIGAGAAVAGVTAVAGPAAIAAASGITGTPSITLTPATGSRGGTIQVNGSNFYAGTGRLIQTVTVDGITVTPSNVIITATGTTAFTFVIPAGATLSADSVQVTDNHNNTASATLTVQAPPTITFPTVANPVNPGHNGTTTFTLTGSGFVSGLTVTGNGSAGVGSFTYVDASHITVKVTGSGGSGASGSFTVTNPDGTAVTSANGSFKNG